MRVKRMEAEIRRNLKSVDKLIIEDDSLRHAGHAGNSGGAETHFNLLIVSDDFNHLSRVQRQRLVQDLFKSEFASGLHALSMRLFTRDEFAHQK